MKSFWGTLLKGFVTILPLAITLYIVFWIVGAAESIVGGALLLILPESLYIPGMGIVGGVFLLYALGLLMEKSGVMRKLSDFGERQLERIPVVKTVYSSIQNLMEFISLAREEGREERKAVLVNLGDNLRFIGFITGSAEDQLGYSPDEDEETVAVYLPMSYQVGGFTVYVPRSTTTSLDMGFEEATKLVLTAGVGTKKAGKEKAAAQSSP